MTIDTYKYLWDGSELGWALQYIERVIWKMEVHFVDGKPTKAELLVMHRLLPELRAQSISKVYACLAGESKYVSPNEYGSLEARKLSTEAKQAGLNVLLFSDDRSSYIPIKNGKTALVIDDGALAELVVKKMMDAGVPIKTVHID